MKSGAARASRWFCQRKREDRRDAHLTTLAFTWTMSILSWQWSLTLIALFGMALAQTSTPKPATGTPSKAIAALAKLEGKPLDVALLSQLLEFHDAAFEVVQEELIVSLRKEVKASADAMFDSLGLETR